MFTTQYTQNDGGRDPRGTWGVHYSKWWMCINVCPCACRFFVRASQKNHFLVRAFFLCVHHLVWHLGGIVCTHRFVRASTRRGTAGADCAGVVLCVHHRVGALRGHIVHASFYACITASGHWGGIIQRFWKGAFCSTQQPTSNSTKRSDITSTRRHYRPYVSVVDHPVTWASETSPLSSLRLGRRQHRDLSWWDVSVQLSFYVSVNIMGLYRLRYIDYIIPERQSRTDVVLLQDDFFTLENCSDFVVTSSSLPLRLP